jgi:hypothetical protein
MAKGKSSINDPITLQMALVGYQLEKRKVEDKIRELQAQLQGKHVSGPSATTEKPAGKSKRQLSAAARRRIALAQKKRWAEHRKRKAAEKK